MSDFDKWHQEFKGWMHPEADDMALKAWNHQQQKIDEIYELKQKMVERVIELSAENEKLQNRLRRLK